MKLKYVYIFHFLIAVVCFFPLQAQDAIPAQSDTVLSAIPVANSAALSTDIEGPATRNRNGFWEFNIFLGIPLNEFRSKDDALTNAGYARQGGGLSIGRVVNFGKKPGLGLYLGAAWQQNERMGYSDIIEELIDLESAASSRYEYENPRSFFMHTGYLSAGLSHEVHTERVSLYARAHANFGFHRMGVLKLIDTDQFSRTTTYHTPIQTSTGYTLEAGLVAHQRLRIGIAFTTFREFTLQYKDRELEYADNSIFQIPALHIRSSVLQVKLGYVFDQSAREKKFRNTDRPRSTSDVMYY